MIKTWSVEVEINVVGHSDVDDGGGGGYDDDDDDDVLAETEICLYFYFPPWF